MVKIEITKTKLVWPGKYNEDGTQILAEGYYSEASAESGLQSSWRCA